LFDDAWPAEGFLPRTTSLAAASVTIRNGDPDLGPGEGAIYHPNDRGIHSDIYGGP